MKHLPTLLLLTALACAACKKDKPIATTKHDPLQDTIHFEAEQMSILPYIDFGEGSTWRYANFDSSNFVDTRCIGATQNRVSVPQEKNCQPFTFINFRRDIVSSDSANNSHLSIDTRTWFVFDKPQPGQAPQPDKGYIQYYLSCRTVEFVHGKLSALTYWYGTDTVKEYAKYTVRGKTYANVFTYSVPCTHRPNIVEPILVFAKGIGPIRYYDDARKEFYDLVDYHIMH